MPSLKVPWVWRRKSFSSTRSISLYRPMDGMVASPTPMIPISSDSTRVMVRRGPMTLAIAAAAIHPAVPPPAITTDLISCTGMGLRAQVLLKLIAERGGVNGSVFLILDDIKRRRAHLIEHERLVGQVTPGQVHAQ